MDFKEPYAQVPPGPSAAVGGGGAPSGTVLARSLAGALPCVVCRYDLQGVSVRGVCPECGTLVRASILAIVDPLASELTPIKRPRLVGFGIVLWTGCSLLACVLGLITTLDLVISNWSVPASMGEATVARAWLIAGLLVIAGLGVLAFARPHGRVPMRASVWAALGGVAYVPLAVCVVWTARVATSELGSGELRAIWPMSPTRTWLSLAGWCLALAIIALVRPIARVLVARNLAMRTGRVDRQTLIATAAAIGVLMLGDALGMYAHSHAVPGTSPGTLALLAVAMVALGALLLVMGLAGSCVDGLRIARAIVRPGPSLRTVVETAAAPQRREPSGGGGAP
jgi:hypothetical protein